MRICSQSMVIRRGGRRRLTVFRTCSYRAANTPSLPSLQTGHVRNLEHAEKLIFQSTIFFLFSNNQIPTRYSLVMQTHSRYI